MKKTIALLACGVAAAGSVQAQAVVAGFDFGNLGETQSVGNFNANTSTAVGAAGDFAKGLFTLYTKNSAFASDTDPYAGQVTNPGSGWWQAGDDFGGGVGTAGDNNLHTVRGTAAAGGATAGGIAAAINTDLAGIGIQFTGAVDGGWFSFGVGSAFEGLTVEFDARIGGSSFEGTQSWYYITEANAADIASGDFSSAINTGTYLAGSSYADQSIVLGDVEAGYLVFTTSTGNEDPFTVGGTDGLFLDNVTFSGTAVAPIPEPSAFAAIFGALALAGVALRRRSRVA